MSEYGTEVSRSMGSSPKVTRGANVTLFPFRPWVRRAGLSIVLMAAAITALIVAVLVFWPASRYGWMGERFVWVYVGTLWLGGLKVWLGTMRPVAEAGEETLILRPLHQLRERVIRWEELLGTEQMIRGDRMIVYYQTPRGMRFVAMNLNLIKGRREFLALVDGRLAERGFVERIVERSRYRSPAS
jgi:hypothetical protein